MNLSRNIQITAEVAAKLNSVQWDFNDSKTRAGVHGIHPYPAKFIPQIPASLIRLFPPDKGTSVLDPFCGSGTTLVEALEAGKQAVGIDLNPLAALIAKVKTTPLQNDLDYAGRVVYQEARNRVNKANFSIPNIPNLDHWFQKPVQQALAALITEISVIPDVDIADALRVALSSIIVRVSNQDSDTRYAAVEKNISQEDVWSLFDRAVRGLNDMLKRLTPNLFPNVPPVHIINKDLMTVEPEDITTPVGLVVTSPPYPNAYEYWLYHKYRMFWLGMDPIIIRGKEIGARPHYFKKNPQTEMDFERQMGRCFWLLSRVMQPAGYACFVVGRSIIHGREIDNEALLERAAASHGFTLEGSISRTIASNKKSFNPSHGKIHREGILVFSQHFSTQSKQGK